MRLPARRRLQPGHDPVRAVLQVHRGARHCLHRRTRGRPVVPVLVGTTLMFEQLRAASLPRA